MQKTITYVRRILPQESKRVPAPRLGRHVTTVPTASRQTPPFQGSIAVPVNPVLPPSRISQPQ